MWLVNKHINSGLAAPELGLHAIFGRDGQVRLGLATLQKGAQEQIALPVRLLAVQQPGQKEAVLVLLHPDTEEIQNPKLIGATAPVLSEMRTVG